MVPLIPEATVTTGAIVTQTQIKPSNSLLVFDLALGTVHSPASISQFSARLGSGLGLGLGLGSGSDYENSA